MRLLNNEKELRGRKGGKKERKEGGRGGGRERMRGRELKLKAKVRSTI